MISNNSMFPRSETGEMLLILPRMPWWPDGIVCCMIATEKWGEPSSGG